MVGGGGDEPTPQKSTTNRFISHDWQNQGKQVWRAVLYFTVSEALLFNRGPVACDVSRKLSFWVFARAALHAPHPPTHPPTSVKSSPLQMAEAKLGMSLDDLISKSQYKEGGAKKGGFHMKAPKGRVAFNHNKSAPAAAAKAGSAGRVPGKINERIASALGVNKKQAAIAKPRVAAGGGGGRGGGRGAKMAEAAASFLDRDVPISRVSPGPMGQDRLAEEWLSGRAGWQRSGRLAEQVGRGAAV